MLLHKTNDTRKVFWLVFSLVLLTRLPFLGSGLGYDADLWRVMNVGMKLAQTGEYYYSRFPGFPLHEFFAAFLWDKPPIIAVALTSLMTSVGIGLFAVTLKGFRVSNVTALSLATACTPIVFINSTTFMDYLWSFSFLLIAFRFVVAGRGLLAGICIGLAAGWRFTALFMIVPFSLVLGSAIEERVSIRRLAGFLLFSMVTTIIVYVPVILNFHPAPKGTQKEGPNVALLDALYKGSIGVWGVVGFLAILAATGFALYHLVRLRRQPPRHIFTALPSKLLLASLIVVLIHGAIFFRYSYEAAYVIPGIPFLLLMVATYLPRRAVVGLSALIVLSSLVIGTGRTDNPEGLQQTPAAFHFTMGKQEGVVDLLQGPLLLDIQRRRNTRALIDHLYAYADSTRARSVVVVGWFLPQIECEQRGATGRGGVAFVEHLTRADIAQFIKSGYQIRFLHRMDTMLGEPSDGGLLSAGGKELRL